MFDRSGYEKELLERRRQLAKAALTEDEGLNNEVRTKISGTSPCSHL
jgi:hypothetical protein